MNVQGGMPCFHSAVQWGHLELAKFLYGLGGKKLLMLNSKVRVCVIVGGDTFMYVSTCIWPEAVAALGAKATV